MKSTSGLTLTYPKHLALYKDFSVNKHLKKATSIQCFMISSIYSNNRDVIDLFTATHMNADELLSMTKCIIKLLYDSGFKVSYIK